MNEDYVQSVLDNLGLAMAMSEGATKKAIGEAKELISEQKEELVDYEYLLYTAQEQLIIYQDLFKSVEAYKTSPEIIDVLCKKALQI